MKQRFGMIVVLLVLLLTATYSHAAAPWSAWIYRQASGAMTMVNQDGAVLDSFVLPSEAGYTYSRNVAVSDTGTLFAYVVSAGTDPFNGYLYIYDRPADTVRYAFDMGPTPTHSLDFSASNLNFSADGSTFAFGYANSDMSRWWALVVDLTTYDVVGGIRSTDPLAISTGLRAEFLLPVVQYNRDGQVVFTPVFLATEGLAEYDAYTWDVAAITLTPNPAYRTLSNDTFLPTGEVVMPFEDPRFPMDPSGEFVYAQFNTLQVYDPALGGRYPFYVDATMFYYSAQFVQGGERILASSSDVNSSTFTSLIDRSGALLGYFAPAVGISSAAGVLDGFIYTTNDLDSERRPQLLYVETRDGLDASETGVPVWTGSLRDDVATVVWQSDELVASATPFTAWAQLAAPSNPLESLPEIGGAPVTPAPLVVGGQATINTTGGDQLNVRSGAGTSFNVVTRLDAGVVVTLLEGPVSVDGLTWWRIRTDNGVEGWVVESIEDGSTRLQTLVPR